VNVTMQAKTEINVPTGMEEDKRSQYLTEFKPEFISLEGGFIGGWGRGDFPSRWACIPRKASHPRFVRHVVQWGMFQKGRERTSPMKVDHPYFHEKFTLGRETQLRRRMSSMLQKNVGAIGATDGHYLGIRGVELKRRAG